MGRRDSYAGEDQEQRPAGGAEGPAEQEVAQSGQTREREREIKAAETERSNQDG